MDAGKSKEHRDYCSMDFLLKQGSYHQRQRREIIPRAAEEIRQGKSGLEAYARKWARAYQILNTPEAALHFYELVERLGFKKKR